MTQRQEAHCLLAKLTKMQIFSAEWAMMVNHLDELVATSQNRKPLGDADGSINETMWNSLNQYVGAARAAADNHNIMLNHSRKLALITVRV